MSKIQKAIGLVGDRGRYQKILLVLFVLIYLELGLMLLGSGFIFMNPTFDCPSLPAPTEDHACQHLDVCILTNPFTITSYADLKCGRQGDRSLIQSSIYIGAILGLLILMPSGDKRGKKFIFVLSQTFALSGVVLILSGALLGATWVLVIGQICIGAGCYSVMITGYVILSELTEDKFKQYSITTLNAIWAVSQIVIAGLFFWYNDWFDYVLIILLIPNVALLLFSFFFLVESPYYLIEKKTDLAAAMKAVEKIAKYNRTSQTLGEVKVLFEEALEEVKDSKRKSGADIRELSQVAVFKDKKYVKILLMIAILQIGANVYYYGVQFSLGELGTSFGYNILIMGGIETIAFFSSNLFITKVPRKFGMLMFNFVSVGLGMLFFIPWIADHSIAQTLLLGACRFFNTFTMSIVPMMQNESFPHRYRSMAWGYIEGLSQMGNFITPFIVTGCQNAGINALIVCSFILIVMGTLPMMFTRETLNVSEDDYQAEQNMLSFSKDSLVTSLSQ